MTPSGSRGPLRILQVSTYDVAGGAEQVALNLHRAHRDRGHEAWLAVGGRRSSEPNVLALNPPTPGLSGIIERRGRALTARAPAFARVTVNRAVLLAALLARPARLQRLLRGAEEFDFPATASLLELPPAPPDVVHCHNLHGGYFDLRQLPAISQRVPVVLTLHDMWTMTGHCAHSFACERWRSACGTCPDLRIYPPVLRDRTRENLAVKRDVFRRSRLRVCAPSRWLLDKARASVLAEGSVEWRVIPNGVDLSAFNPGDRTAARERLGLAADDRVLLFAAQAGKRNPFKDYDTIRDAVGQLSERPGSSRIVLLVLGESGEAEASGRTRFIPFVTDRAVVADYYRAADLYLHAARADTFPNTVIESLACGTPVVATAVGGIPEQIEDGATGVVVPPAAPREMAAAIEALLASPDRLSTMRARAAESARERFDLEQQADAYCAWFADLRREQERSRGAAGEREPAARGG